MYGVVEKRIHNDVLKLIERKKNGEDKQHLIQLFDGYMFMVQYIRGDVKWMSKHRKLLI